MIDIFQEAPDDGCEPHRRIADHVGCDEICVLVAFRGLDVPEWSTPEHLRQVGKKFEELSEAALCAERLAASFKRLNPSERLELQSAGTVTLEQIEHLAAVLRGDALDLNDWLKQRGKKTSKNVAAHTVAEGMRRLFRRLRRPIKYGVNAEHGGPSTEFCRSVQAAIEAFGIPGSERSNLGVANWRGPSRTACDKQKSIQARLIRCSVAAAERDNTN